MSRPALPRRAAVPPSLPTHVRLAGYAARSVGALARQVRGGSGTVIAGRALRMVAPDAVSALCAGREVILISGTNGKTTTTALTVAALGDRAGVTNADGANTASGVAGALATGSHASSRSPDDQGIVVLEVDEGWLPWAIRETGARTVILSNLSRDQLSRHHEVGALAATCRAALADVPLVVANADDQDVVWAAQAARHQVWVAAGGQWTGDSLVCPHCGGRCVASGGSWACDGCDLHRPEVDWWLEGEDLCGRTGRVPLRIDLPGRFNLANAALALAAVHAAAGVDLATAAGRLGAVRAVSGRYERVSYRGHDVRILLAKNPAGWMELLELMAPDRHPVILTFNADGVDGRDPSWLYDVSFEPLRGRTVVVQGDRATDLQVRLELDGVDVRRVPGELAAALWQLPAGQVDVVGNYTAFRNALKEVRRG
jgi:UDP-N-acetylmuramyl tripeptide synthase